MNDKILTNYYAYLKFERNFTDNTVQAYVSDVQKLQRYVENHARTLETAETPDILSFLCTLRDVGISPESQARILSGIKSFYRFLLMERILSKDPSELVEAPQKVKKVPVVLSLEEVNRIIQAPDPATCLGQRNRAILETLYSCGIRVSELIALRISNIYEKEGFIMVMGKGRKQRIVPIAESALNELRLFFAFRYELDVKPGHEDYVFLNRFGRKMSRIAVFNIVKQYCAEVGITKEISPHTFRHTFATHLLEGGANLRAIQMMLGHEQISTTELYAKADSQFLREDILTYHPRNKLRNT